MIPTIFQAASRRFRQFHRFREPIHLRRILLRVQHRLPKLTRRILTRSKLIPLGVPRRQPTPLTAITWSQLPRKLTLSQSSQWRMDCLVLSHPQADFVVVNPSPNKIALTPRSITKFKHPHRVIHLLASICPLGYTDNASRSLLLLPPPNAEIRLILGSNEIAAIASAQVAI